MNEEIHRRRIPGAQFFLAALFAWIAPIHAVAAEPPPEVRTAAYLEKLWDSNQAPGMSVVIAWKGSIVFSQGFGFADLDNLVPATASTVYNMGSISKTETAVAVMQLVEQGKISLNHPIQKYVPSFPDKGSPITLLQLLTYTSGIRHYRDNDFPGPYGGYSENMRPYHALDEAIKTSTMIRFCFDRASSTRIPPTLWISSRAWWRRRAAWDLKTTCGSTCGNLRAC